jgi:hypothetical protein
MQFSRDFFDVKKESPRTPNPRRPKKTLTSFFRSESAALFANDAPASAIGILENTVKRSKLAATQENKDRTNRWLNTDISWI